MKSRTAILAGATLLSLCFFISAVIHRQHRAAQAAIKGTAGIGRERPASPPALRSARPEPLEVAGDWPKGKQDQKSETRRTRASRQVTTSSFLLAFDKPLGAVASPDAATTIPTGLNRFLDAMTTATRQSATSTTATLAEAAPTSAAADRNPDKYHWIPNVAGTVTDPAGHPLAGAEVYLRDRIQWTSYGGLNLFGGRYDDHGLRSYGQVMTTDRSGVFQFQTQALEYEIVVLHASGIALRLKEEYTSRGVIVVPPWGRIEGTVIAGNNPIPRLWLRFTFGRGLVYSGHLVDAPQVPLSGLRGRGRGDRSILPNTTIYYYTVTDDAGHFVIDQVQAGTVASVEAGDTFYTIRRYVYDRYSSLYANPFQIRIKPGETTRLQISGTGFLALTVLNPSPTPTPDANSKELIMAPVAAPGIDENGGALVAVSPPRQAAAHQGGVKPPHSKVNTEFSRNPIP